jgi:methylated-DNA-protein-cysteine methyltransferase-like protein
MKEQSFTQQVYRIVRGIPAGKVATYGQIAQLAGSPGAARAVGTAMKHNPDMSTIPCHRVVGSDGSMHGYAFGDGVSTKEQMLKLEGVKIAGGKVDLAVSGWR